MIGGTFAAHHPDRVRVAILMNGTASPCGPRQLLQFQLMVQIGCLLRGIRGPGKRHCRVPLPHQPEGMARDHGECACRARTDRFSVGTLGSGERRHSPSGPTRTVPDHPYRRIGRRRHRGCDLPRRRNMHHGRRIPGALFVVMQRPAHLAGLEYPAETSDMIEAFIRRR